MTVRFDNPAWSDIAKQSEDDIKEALITGYKSGKSYHPHHFYLIEQGTRVGSILDFGCGIGRNFESLGKHCENLYAFDLPEMIRACQKYSDYQGDVGVMFEWDEVITNRYDMTAVILCLQHLKNVETLEHILLRLARSSTYLYVVSRSWQDGDKNNVFATIMDTGVWELLRCSCKEDELAAFEHPNEFHFEAVFKTQHAGQLKWSEGRSKVEVAAKVSYEVPKWKAPNGVAIVQLFDDYYDNFAWDVMRHTRAYAQQHGYSYHYRHKTYDEHQDRHPSWHRIPFVKEVFSEIDDGSWVFWTDIDSLIMRTDLPLETHIHPHRDKDLILVNQGPGTCLGEMWQECICFGQFFIKKTPWSIKFLEKVWEFPTSKAGDPKFITQPSWEQDAVNYCHKHDVLGCKEHAAVVPNRQFNSFEHGQYQKGDFVVHFAGVRDRLEIEKKVRRYLSEGHGHRFVEELPNRDALSSFIPEGGVGIELGVMQGIHAVHLLEHARPRKLHLVDFWSHHHAGAEWVRYKAQVESIFAGKSNVTLHDADIRDVVPSFPDNYFDWAYIDSWHDYRHVKRDITLTLPKLRPGGLLCGHDLMIEPDDWHTGPPRAVIEAIQNEPLTMVALTNEYLGDWALRKDA